MSEQAYESLTYTLTLAAAETLARLNPAMTFVYVSGAGTDSSEKGRPCGRESKAKRKTPSCACLSKPPTCFGPGVIQPVHGVRSSTTRIPHRIRIARAHPSLAPPPVSTLYPDDRRNRPRDDPRGKARRFQRKSWRVGTLEIARDFVPASRRREGIGHRENRPALTFRNVPYNKRQCKIARTTTIPGPISDPWL